MALARRARRQAIFGKESMSIAMSRTTPVSAACVCNYERKPDGWQACAVVSVGQTRRTSAVSCARSGPAKNLMLGVPLSCRGLFALCGHSSCPAIRSIRLFVRACLPLLVVIRDRQPDEEASVFEASYAVWQLSTTAIQICSR